MTIGVGVEGERACREFWSKVLHKWLDRSRDVRFHVQGLRGREDIIAGEAGRFRDACRDAGYDACFIIVDQHRVPCFPAVLERCAHDLRCEARRPLEERFLFICVADRGFECWLLADVDAVQMQLPGATYGAVETSLLNPRDILEQLWQAASGRLLSYDSVKQEFAGLMGSRFDPDRAMSHSASFSYFWNRITQKVSGARVSSPQDSS